MHRRGFRAIGVSLMAILGLSVLGVTLPTAVAAAPPYARPHELPHTALPIVGMQIKGLSSTFGPRRQGSLGGEYDWHRGIDIPTPCNTKVLAVADGTVETVDSDDYQDLTVRIRHPATTTTDTWYSLYTHLSALEGVTNGAPVLAGAVIARSGESSIGWPQDVGWTPCGPDVNGVQGKGFDHLHFEVRDAGRKQLYAVHPLRVLGTSDVIAPTITRMTVDPGVASSLVVTVELKVGEAELDLDSVNVTVADASGDLQRIENFAMERWTYQHSGDPTKVAILDTPAMGATGEYTGQPVEGHVIPWGEDEIVVAPKSFNSGTTDYEMTVTFTFKGFPAPPPAWRVVATAKDIWGNAKVSRATVNTDGTKSYGEPHLTTVDGLSYDFQAVGEFVYLRGADGLEVQTRQAPFPSNDLIGPDRYSGLSTCLAANSAVAARVGTHRVTYQPGPSGLETRIDGGDPVTLSEAGISLEGGGLVVPTAVGGLQIVFPRGVVLTATPGSHQGHWYLNVDLTGGQADEGITGARPPGSWLPGLPDGASVGPMPAALAERYDQLFGVFTDAWRVTDDSSLFDYAPGESTADFTDADWPDGPAPCLVDGLTPLVPLDLTVAEQACADIVDEQIRRDCAFDVSITGDRGFAETYLRTERMRRWGTTTTVSFVSGEVAGRPLILATVAPTWPGSAEGTPAGAVQFYVGDTASGSLSCSMRPVSPHGYPPDLIRPEAPVSARYLPSVEGTFLGSSSPTIADPDD